MASGPRAYMGQHLAEADAAAVAATDAAYAAHMRAAFTAEAFAPTDGAVSTRAATTTSTTTTARGTMTTTITTIITSAANTRRTLASGSGAGLPLGGAPAADAVEVIDVDALPSAPSPDVRHIEGSGAAQYGHQHVQGTNSGGSARVRPRTARMSTGGKAPRARQIAPDSDSDTGPDQ